MKLDLKVMAAALGLVSGVLFNANQLVAGGCHATITCSTDSGGITINCGNKDEIAGISSTGGGKYAGIGVCGKFGTTDCGTNPGSSCSE